MTLSDWIQMIDAAPMEPRVHASATPIEAVDVRAIGDQWRPGFVAEFPRPNKPVGLWYGVGSSWLSWCSVNDIRARRIRHLYRVTPPENMLRISTHTEMLDFQAEYGIPEDGPVWKIHWQRVATNFDGIEIAPYQYAARISGAPWYSGWDVASGCVWRGARVEYLGKVEEG